MKLTITQNNLNKGLQLVARVVANKGQMPILANVLLQATKTGLLLSATNLEIGLRVEAGGKVDSEGAISIPAKTLSEFVASLVAGNVELTVVSEKLKIVSEKSSAQFTGISASEFPTLPNVGVIHESPLLESKSIRDIATQVAFAAATDDSRPVLTGVQYSILNNQLNIVATDGFRMSRKILLNTEYRIPDTGLILPARTILELARIVGEEGESVTMDIISESNQVVFTCGTVQLISRVLEGNFPDVTKIIPVEWKTQVIIDRQEFLRAIKAASIFARENNNIVKFSIYNFQFTIKASAQQLGDNESTIEAETEGEDNEIAFNYKYVVDFLNSVESERIIMRINDKLPPCLFVPEKDDTLVHVIMPVRA